MSYKYEQDGAKVPESKDKYGQTHFDEAMNAPNTPRPAGSKHKDDQGSSYNVTYEYTKGDNSK
jgi:hypothetical protein